MGVVLAQAVGIAVEVDDDAVTQEAVGHGGGGAASVGSCR